MTRPARAAPPLEPALAALVARAGEHYPADAAQRTPAEQRALYERFAACAAPRMPDGLRIDDAHFSARAGHALAVRRYRPLGRITRGTVLFFHGGGFVVGSLDSHHALTARLAADTGFDVIALDYRLAPEHRAPAAHDDCVDAALAALRGDLPFGPVAAPLMLAGDSAGGTLAAGAAAALRDAGCDGIAALALVYPLLGHEPCLPAALTEADAPLLTLADVHAYRRAYWGDAPPPPDTVPLDAARFDGLPPTLAIGAQHDPLCDDARVYVERIAAAGGRARFLFGAGLVHGCWRALDTSARVAAMHGELCAFLLEQRR
jgi:acetyl esterase